MDAKSSRNSRGVRRPNIGRPRWRNRDANPRPACSNRAGGRAGRSAGYGGAAGEYEQWRTEFKTWGRWAPVGQESKGTTSLITPEKVASAMRLTKDGIVVSLAHAEPQTVAADVPDAGLFRRTMIRLGDDG